MDWLTMSILTNLAQLSLLDLSGKSTGQSAEISWIPVTDLHPHPDNPRLIYRQDIIDTIASSIAEGGFKPEYALLVRLFGDGYQVISGHTRLKAAQQAGCSVLPCWVKDLDDESAFMELVLANNQGELSPLEYGMHVLKYVELSEGGRGKKGGLSEYARVVGKSRPRLSEYKDAADIVKTLNVSDVGQVLDKANHLAAIHKAPDKYWQQLTELLIENEWSVKQTEGIVDAIKCINIPDYLQFWLNPDRYIKATISEFLSSGEPRTPKDLANWIKAAEDCLEKLPDSRQVHLFDEGFDTEEIQYIDLKSDFLEKLPDLNAGDKKPSVSKINEIATDLWAWIDKLEKDYKAWKARKSSKDELNRQNEEKARLLAEMRVKYNPLGLNIPIQNFMEHWDGNPFSAVITDIPYIVSTGGFTVRSGKEALVDKNFEDFLHPSEYVQILFDVLSPGGVFVTTCTIHILPDLIQESVKAGFVLRQKLIWYKRNSPPLLAADRFKPDYEDILVFIKAGQAPYFGYDEIKIDGDKQRGAVIDLPQCGGKERQYGHDTQKPEALYELLIRAYVPEDGRLLEPFGGSGTTPVVCKKLKRQSVWIEKSEHFYNVAQSRIDDTSFPWE